MEFKKITVIALIIMLALSPVFAETLEAASVVTTEARVLNFHQEFDMTFWQTLPFAAFWGHFIDRQLFPASPVHWEVIWLAATIVSATNAFRHARRVTENK